MGMWSDKWMGEGTTFRQIHKEGHISNSHMALRNISFKNTCHLDVFAHTCVQSTRKVVELRLLMFSKDHKSKKGTFVSR